MTRITLGLIVAAGLLSCSACGSPAVGNGVATNPNGLASTSTPPSDFTSIPALVASLTGTATCLPDGTNTDSCKLVTATDEPFLLIVFPNSAATQAYLVTVKGVDSAAISRGVTPIGALVGAHWVALPKVEAPGLLGTLQMYLGGTRLV